MRLSGDIRLELGINGRWYLFHDSKWDPRAPKLLGSPEGYASHVEGSKWRSRFQKVAEVQQRSKL